MEVLISYRLYERGSPTPTHYSKPGFWIIRVLVAMVAGSLVVAHHIVDQPLLAMHIGIATPAILAGLAEEIRNAARSSE